MEQEYINKDQISDSKELGEFDKVENVLAGLEQEMQTVPDCTTKDGYQLNKQQLSMLRPLRTGIDSLRKELNKPDQDKISARNSEAAAITARIVKLEEPRQAAKKIEDTKINEAKVRAKKIENERIEAIRNRIKEIEATWPDETIEKINLQINYLDAIDLAEFQEFEDHAASTISLKKQQLNNQMGILIEAEKTAKENDRIIAEAEEQQRIIDQQKAEIEESKRNLDQQRLDAEQRIKDQKQQAEREAREKIEAAELEAKQKQDQADAKALEDRKKIQEEQRKVDAQKKEIADTKRKEEEAKAATFKKEQAEKAEAERLEAIKPDLEKVNKWLEEIEITAANIPAIENQCLSALSVEFVSIVDDKISLYRKEVGLEDE
jgi:hypothetical protein